LQRTSKKPAKRAKKAPERKRIGRPKLYGQQILLLLSAGMLADIDAIVGEDETRLDLIRGAIEREIERRCRAQR
jgi:hypothetical protein